MSQIYPVFLNKNNLIYFRRFSVSDLPLPARLPSKPPGDQKSKKKVRTQEPGQQADDGNYEKQELWHTYYYCKCIFTINVPTN